jgi:hypothetical protein
VNTAPATSGPIREVQIVSKVLRFMMIHRISIPLPRLIIFSFFVLSTAFLLVCQFGTVSFAEQTKEECRACCDGMGFDDYYLEQCKLKCYRNPDHCKGGKVKDPPPVAKKKKTIKKKKKKKKKKKRIRRKKITLRFPSPLSITPGEEWKTAVEILVINGITSRNRNFVAAVQSVERVLADFTLNNPQGGQLPTTQLEQIIVKYK